MSQHKGWLDTLTYPQSTPGYRLALKYAYQNGMLKSVSDANASTVFWTADSTNSWGQITQEPLGNNVITTRAFDAVNARLSSIRSGLSGKVTISTASNIRRSRTARRLRQISS